MKTNFFPDELKGIDLTTIDNVEVHPVQEDNKGNVQVCEEESAMCWSVYLHKAKSGLICIADLPDRVAADNLKDLLKRLLEI